MRPPKEKKIKTHTHALIRPQTLFLSLSFSYWNARRLLCPALPCPPPFSVNNMSQCAAAATAAAGGWKKGELRLKREKEKSAHSNTQSLLCLWRWRCRGRGHVLSSSKNTKTHVPLKEKKKTTGPERSKEDARVYTEEVIFRRVVHDAIKLCSSSSPLSSQSWSRSSPPPTTTTTWAGLSALFTASRSSSAPSPPSIV